jgi:pimeloyl-ACP methyl ester carboxylesterase
MPNVFAYPRVIDTALGKVEYSMNEGGQPVVLVVHGGMGGYDQARVLADFLGEKDYRLLCPSRPGYLGTPLESGRTMEEQADLLAALLDTLNINKVVVVSASAGGPPGYFFAIRHPDRIKALVSIDSVSGFYDMPESAGPIAKALFLSNIGQKILLALEARKPEQFLQEIYVTSAYLTKEQVKKHIEHAMNSPEALAFLKAFMTTMFPYDKRKAGTENDLAQLKKLTHLPVESIKCPSLIVHGTHDADVKFYDGVYAHEHITGSERHWIEEGSHVGFWLNPKAHEAQEVVRAFLKRVK